MKDLFFSNHIQDKINKAYAMYGVIKQITNIYSSLVLSYDRTWSDPILIIVVASRVWTPYRKGEATKRATRLLPELKVKGFKYCDRLKACKLPNTTL